MDRIDSDDDDSGRSARGYLNTPNPDPTVLTTEAVERAIKAERIFTDSQLEVIRERLRGIDVATRLLNETVNRTPTQIQTEVAHLTSLTEEKFRSVGSQFHERDVRSERESRDNKVAVDAAFAAQKEAAAAQDKANREAIDKSERATAETIKANQELSNTSIENLRKSLDEVKLAVASINAHTKGTVDNTAESRANVAVVISAVIALLSIIGLITTVLIAKP